MRPTRPAPLQSPARALRPLAAAAALAASLAHGEQRAEAWVTLSDGTALSGQVRLIGARPLTLVPLGQDRQRTFLFDDLAAIDQEVEAATLERPWTFKEAGKAEKVYLDGHYPLLNFRTRLTLASGASVTGHVISAVLALSGEEGQRKLFLQRQIKGELEQRLEDVVYVASLRFAARPLQGSGPIRGTVEGFGRVLSVTALDTAREQVLAAKVTPDGRFDFGAVLPGRYDLCVLTDTHALVGLSDAVPAGAEGPPLQAADLEGVNRLFPLADDFFNQRWLLNLAGNRSFAKALVYKRRADYYEAERWTPGGFLWHLEVWSWHFAEPDWKIDRRSILIRHKQKGGEQNRKLLRGRALGAVAPGATLTLRATSGNDDEWQPLRDLD